MKKLLLSFLVVHFTFLISDAQVNLVPNPSFEDTVSCPTQSSEITFASGWIDANTGTADYFNACYTTGGVSVDVPSNWMGFQNANSGNAYVGIMLFENSSTINNYREYIQTQLTSTLINGVKYYVSFRISHADSSCFNTDDIGVYFSNTQISQGNYFVINQTPQIENISGNILNDNSNWVKIQGSFIAVGGENFLIIGNFKDDNNTSTISVCSTSNLDYKSAYYYIDDVCISTDSMICVNPLDIKLINDYHKHFSISISDNNLLINSSDNELFNISIYNTSGLLVHELRNQQNSIQINLDKFRTSVYLVNVHTSSENFTQKIFINR